MRRASKNANARFIFRQGSKNADYLYHLYALFQNYVLALPVETIIVDKNTNKARTNLSFATIALPCFNEFYDLFYPDIKKLYLKILVTF